MYVDDRIHTGGEQELFVRRQIQAKHAFRVCMHCMDLLEGLE